MTMVLPEKANRERRDLWLFFKNHLQRLAFEEDGCGHEHTRSFSATVSVMVTQPCSTFCFYKEKCRFPCFQVKHSDIATVKSDKARRFR